MNPRFLPSFLRRGRRQLTVSAHSLVHTAAQNTLSTRNIAPSYTALTTSLTRCPTSHSKRLERALCPVVVVVAVDTLDMQGNARCLSKAFQTMGDHFRRQVADLLSREAQIDD